VSCAAWPRCAPTGRGSVFFSEHVEFHRLNRGAPVGDARGDDHISTLELRKRFFYFSCGFKRVGIVEDQKPSGMLAEPTEHGGQANDFLGLVPFGQIKNRRVAKPRKVGTEVDRRASTNKEQRILIITPMTPCVFDGKACFAYAAQSMDRLPSGETNCSSLPGDEPLPELCERSIATFKERAEGGVGQVPWLRHARLQPEAIAKYQGAQPIERAKLVPILSASIQVVDEFLLQLRSVVRLRDHVHLEEFRRSEVKENFFGRLA
jgi:hypothetical protein